MTKNNRRIKIKAHIRTKVSGNAERPRLTVFRSNAQIYAQVIDDVKGITLASASSLGKVEKGMKKEAKKEKINKTEQAASVGKQIAKAAIEAGINEVVFDRNGYLYHGRVKQLADAAREGGLKF
ncbi:MAG: 50S ribosomal protein L18 [Paludibacteraceae bacterium]